MTKILSVEDLHVRFKTYGGEVQAVRGVTFDLYKGETLAIVGESGCGKSVTSQSIMRLIPTPPGRIHQGKIFFNNKDLTRVSEKEMRAIRGVDISMIFQDPMTALNPTLTIGSQMIEGICHHKNISKQAAREKSLQMLKLVGIPNPEIRMKQYPHEFSGGMRQRIVIAMALVCEPHILIADEPTTALDVTIQAQILDLFKEIQSRTNVSIILITHDLGVVASVADRVVVMYGGKIVEEGTCRDIFYHPQHPYTKGLLYSVPRLDSIGEELTPIPGTPPDLFSPPIGCAFAARCPHSMIVCEKIQPLKTTINEQHYVDCWLMDKRAKG
ncbi:ABC transporter ATP-binding protein [Bacillus massiliigorillae]|uniref:ABC transporter ATP-binding protein n=1 Tax=Bacillus massiliigorillae TaxID=1243664 RepID=UPI0003AA00C4|nr:ABC transporter ATP-binding protein [Bacillus massiliigorillae]